MAAKRKKSSLDNSMLNHPGHVTHSSWIFLSFLPVVDIIGRWGEPGGSRPNTTFS